MNYLQAENISKIFGEKVLFENLSFSINQGEKIALIAPNGAGKTSLLNIIAGLDNADAGLCSFKKDLRIAYLQQDPQLNPEMKVSEALLQSDNELSRLVLAYEEELTNQNQDTNKLNHLVEKMDALGAWGYEQRINQVVSALKIGNLHALIGALSGGQKKRLALAAVLLADADLFLMDEPTNHLDLDMIEWMEGFLSQKKTTMLLVTHDRYFLDAICNGIIELYQGIIYSHRGNYSWYLEKKQERLEVMQASSEKAANLLRKETEWMQRSPQARTTKSKARIDAFYELKDKASIKTAEGMDKIHMQMTRMGSKILELNDVSKQFDDKVFIDNFSYVFKKGERIGIVGPNGSGKSTLLNIITGSLPPDSGRINTGETIRFGYYRQEGLTVDESKRVIDVIAEIAESINFNGKNTLTASQLLHYFNFQHKTQYDWVYKLSGGEKRRLYLLTILMKNPNFLILDEPTNDFDIESLNVLEDFLQEYKGCLLMVSHDRYFLDHLVDQLFVFEGDGVIKGFTGNYTDYRKKIKAAVKREPEKSKVQPAIAAKAKEKVKLSYKEQQELETLEIEIERLEKTKQDLIALLNSGELSSKELIDTSEQFSFIEASLRGKENRWLQLSEWL